MPRRSVQHTAQTRQSILAKAIDLASTGGLEGLSIGSLATAISMSKSGLFAHFGSKEELQLATVEAARTLLDDAVFREAGTEEAGLPRLAAYGRAWLRYIERGLFRGGCFFAAAASEMDDRPGRVRDRLIALTRGWLDTLETEAVAAIQLGHLDPDSDPAQLVFELHAFVGEANWAFQLHGDGAAFDRAEHAIDRALRSRATEEGLTLLDAG